MFNCSWNPPGFAWIRTGCEAVTSCAGQENGGPGSGWLLPSSVLLGLGFAFTLVGYPLFARRNL